MEIVKGILADDPAMLLRESMGLASDGTHKAFPSHLVDAFFARPRIGDVYRQFEFEHPDNTNNILVAVDPSGGGASQFAVCSAIQLPNGTVVVLGLDLLRTKVCYRTTILTRDLARPVPQALAPEERRERGGGDDEGLRTLRGVPEKARRKKGQHARLQVAGELAVKGGDHFGLAEGKEKHGAPRNEAILVARKLGHAANFELHLVCGLVLLRTEHALEQPACGSERDVELRARLCGVDARAERRPKEQL